VPAGLGVRRRGPDQAAPGHTGVRASTGNYTTGAAERPRVGATGCVNGAGAAPGVDDAGSVIPPRRQGSDIETQSRLAFAEPTIAQGYPEFFARVVAYVGRELWAIVRENAVPLSGNLVIIMIFALGVFQV